MHKITENTGIRSKFTEKPLEYDLKLPKTTGIRSKFTEKALK